MACAATSAAARRHPHDLDSFSDCEADALMLSGYLMTRSTFTSSINISRLAPSPMHWRFRSIEPLATSANESADLEKLRQALSIAAASGEAVSGVQAAQVTGIFCLVVVLAIAVG